jgi:hypothetical protein
MPKENNPEDVQDQGGKRGAQKCVPKRESKSEHVEDEDGDICSPRVETSTEDDIPLT